MSLLETTNTYGQLRVKFEYGVPPLKKLFQYLETGVKIFKP